MSSDKPNRLDDARLDASLSVLGDDEGGDPKVGRIGSAPRPQSRDGLQPGETGVAAPGTIEEIDAQDALDSQRAARDSINDVAGRTGKA
ncbi:hypothetical protein [Aureimonas sp. AU12]|uniref:hypothetical protein n=1 Tax=Aureimonas sp. AU12 TaxID=1638161 RepID=UPI000780B17B|nr:hypothetical protein [Aureimonas sp. AU12]